MTEPPSPGVLADNIREIWEKSGCEAVNESPEVITPSLGPSDAVAGDVAWFESKYTVA
jgi:hypothetical protein